MTRKQPDDSGRIGSGLGDLVLDWSSKILDRFCRILHWSSRFAKWFQEFCTQLSGLSDESFDADHPLADFSHMINHQRTMDLVRRVPVSQL